MNIIYRLDIGIASSHISISIKWLDIHRRLHFRHPQMELAPNSIKHLSAKRNYQSRSAS